MKKTALPLTTISILLLAFFFSPACSGPRTGDEDKAGEPEKEVAVETQSTDHQPQSAKPVQTGKTINVYIENSGSMYGYVGVGGSDLRNTVYNYLTDVKLSKCFGSMGLNFVNSKVIPQGSAVDDFVKKLEPNTFKVAGGNHGTTDIAEIFKRVYPQQNNSTTVLVSDCIISPGKGHNAAEYLVNQQTGIKGFLGQKNLKNTGVIIYRMLGQFKGPYYNHVDEKKPYQGIRPYYIWVIGDIQQLKQIQLVNPTYKDIVSLLGRYQELSQNSNLNIYLSAGSSDYVALCRKIAAVFYKRAQIKIQDISVNPEYVEITAIVENAKWEDTELFRFYRTSGSVGELYVRDFHSKVRDSKVDKGVCFIAGIYTEEALRYAEGRPIDLVDKSNLTRILKQIDMVNA